MKTSYEIADNGQLNVYNDSNNGFTSLNDAFKDRLDRLEEIAGNDGLTVHLEDDGKWYAKYFYNGLRTAESILDESGKPIIAFDESVDYDALTDFLFENDYEYTG